MGDPDDEAIDAAVKAAPGWLMREAVAETLQVYRPLYGGKLTAEEAVEICINVHRLFDVLFSYPKSGQAADVSGP